MAKGGQGDHRELYVVVFVLGSELRRGGREEEKQEPRLAFISPLTVYGAAPTGYRLLPSVDVATRI